MNPSLGSDTAESDEWDIGDAPLHTVPPMLVGSAPGLDAEKLIAAEYITKAEFEAEYLTTTQAGDIVQLNSKTIERLIHRGKIRAFKPAGKIRIRRKDRDAWIEASAIQERPSVHDI